MTTGGRSSRSWARWREFLCASVAGCLLSVSGLAAAPTQSGRDVWDSDAGLPQNSVQTILQTRVTPVTLDDVFLELTGKGLRD